MPGGNRLPVRELAELALLTALIAGGKEAMNALPNIHPVALLLLLAVLRHGWRALYTAFGFALIEISLYGVSSLAYLYLWPLLVAAAVPFRTNRSPLFWGAFAGIFGLSFGALCAIPYFFIGGWQAALSYWISGIPFDLVHGVSNGVLVYALLLPLYRLMERYFT